MGWASAVDTRSDGETQDEDEVADADADEDKDGGAERDCDSDCDCVSGVELGTSFDAERFGLC